MSPSPHMLHPLAFTRQVVFLKPLAEGYRNVSVGRFAYYDDPDRPRDFFERNVLYHFEHTGSRLTIGPFAAIARDSRIVMDGANHAMEGFSTFPFNIFDEEWAEGFDPATWAGVGDTVIGADVWIGMGATVMPGVEIGAGAIVAARSVVTKDVAPYTIVAGNPARPVRARFEEATVARLLAISWWDWPVGAITAHINLIRGNDLPALEAAAATLPTARAEP